MKLETWTPISVACEPEFFADFGSVLQLAFEAEADLLYTVTDTDRWTPLAPPPPPGPYGTPFLHTDLADLDEWSWSAQIAGTFGCSVTPAKDTGWVPQRVSTVHVANANDTIWELGGWFFPRWDDKPDGPAVPTQGTCNDGTLAPTKELLLMPE